MQRKTWMPQNCGTTFWWHLVLRNHVNSQGEPGVRGHVALVSPRGFPLPPNNLPFGGTMGNPCIRDIWRYPIFPTETGVYGGSMAAVLMGRRPPVQTWRATYLEEGGLRPKNHLLHKGSWRSAGVWMMFQAPQLKTSPNA